MKRTLKGLYARARAQLAGKIRSGLHAAHLHWPGAAGFQALSKYTGEGHPLAFSAVYTCVNLIADDIAKLPPRHYRRKAGGVREEITGSAELDVLNHPNEHQTRTDVVKDLMVAPLLRGNGYLLRINDRNGRPLEIHPVHPDRAAPFIAIDGAVFYDLSLTELEAGPAGNLFVRVPQREVMHHRLFTPFHKLRGISPIFAASISVQIGQQILGHTGAFYENFARPSGVLKTEHILDKDVVERLRDQFQEHYSGENFGKPLVLEQNTEYKPITMSAHDAQLIDTLGFAVKDVARAYSVPLFMLGELDGVTYKNSEQLFRFYYQATLQPRLESLEDRLNRFFGFGLDQFIEFDLSNLLRAETDVRIDAYAKGVQGGIYTSNEARGFEGLDPHPGGDQVLVQQQMVPITQAGAQMDEPKQKALDAGELAEALNLARAEVEDIIERAMASEECAE